MRMRGERLRWVRDSGFRTALRHAQHARTTGFELWKGGVSMKVREVMTKNASFCGPESTLEEASFLMQKNNCGFLPVVGDGGNVVGVVTDRDMCIALGTRNRKPSDVRVWDVMPRKLFTCMEGDDVHCALKTLRAARIRRLPVIDRDSSLVGVLSIDDIVLHAREHLVRKDISYRDVEDTYKAVRGRPTIPVPIKAGVTVSFKAPSHNRNGV
jgi:CBS domain-containing protein